MIYRRFLWAIKRHPLLYTTRFKLLSRNSSPEDISNISYNLVNPKDEIPSMYFKINEKIFSSNENNDDNFEKFKVLSHWLKVNVKGGPGLSLPSEKALKVMLDGGGGVCSDMAQIVNNFCVVNEIEVREWGATRVPYDKEHTGHSFNEIYCQNLQKWILVDVSYGVYFTNDKDEPLSVIEFFKMIKSNKTVIKVPLNEGDYINHHAIDKIYMHYNASPFLICNYSNKLYDKYLYKLDGKIPTFLIHFIVYLSGRSYTYKFPLNDYNKMFV